MIGSPNTINPTLEGIDINRMLRNVSPMMVRRRSRRPLATFSARVGKAAVETAMPKTPSGRSKSWSD